MPLFNLVREVIADVIQHGKMDLQPKKNIDYLTQLKRFTDGLSRQLVSDHTRYSASKVSNENME